MAILPILETPDPRLRTISSPVDRVDDDLRRLIDDMFETMYDAPGIGLAAIQIGAPERVLVIDLQEDGPDGERIRKPQVFINPELFDFSEDTSVYNEGCLSIPELYYEVERPNDVTVKYTDLDGNEVTKDAEGKLAVCIQHELDHLDGVLYIDYLSRLKRDRVIKKFDKAAKRAAG